jgi:hypothetical protein
MIFSPNVLSVICFKPSNAAKMIAESDVNGKEMARSRMTLPRSGLLNTLANDSAAIKTHRANECATKQNNCTCRSCNCAKLCKVFFTIGDRDEMYSAKFQAKAGEKFCDPDQSQTKDDHPRHYAHQAGVQAGCHKQW